jgi:hypothetical protein
MHAVRVHLGRIVGTAGLAGFLLLAPATAAFAATPTPDPSATASPAVSPSSTPDPSPSAAPTDSPVPSDSPAAGGCEQNPVICQSGGAPNTTTDCGQIGPGGEPASPPPPGTVCIAGGLNPGANPGEVTQVTSGSGAPTTLPRTGPAPVLPTVAFGAWLVLIGLAAGIAGRRRTARI